MKGHLELAQQREVTRSGDGDGVSVFSFDASTLYIIFTLLSITAIGLLLFRGMASDLHSFRNALVA